MYQHNSLWQHTDNNLYPCICIWVILGLIYINKQVLHVFHVSCGKFISKYAKGTIVKYCLISSNSCWMVRNYPGTGCMVQHLKVMEQVNKHMQQ